MKNSYLTLKTPKKGVFIWLMLLFFATPLFAKQVDVGKATQVAQSHVNGNNQLRSTNDGVKLVYTAKGSASLRSSGSQSETVYYYVFNVNENDGFVIVSGDDIAIPILGYSTNGAYDNKNLPPAFAYWMECLEKEIDYGIKQNMPQSTSTKQKWDAYLQGNSPSSHYSNASTPLVKTGWDQGAPYNTLCPPIGGVKTVTGCVATAMAQIMYYHKTPATTGTGQSEAYTTATGISIPSINFGNTTYEWNKMSLTYPYTGYSDPDNAVATLMYHCGVSVKMDYDLSSRGGSGAVTKFVGTTLPIHFGYDKGVQWKERATYLDDEWNNLLRTEIDAMRPVLYSGRGSGGGHAFICDGYDTNNMFHFNWGWGNYCDGFYPTNALEPGPNGHGSGTTGEFNSNHGILINIKPDVGGIATSELTIVVGRNFVTSASSVSRGEFFTVAASLGNDGLKDFSGKAYFTLVDANNNIVAEIGSSINFDLKSGYSFGGDYPNAQCVVPLGVAAGTYKIRAYAQANDETSRTLVRVPAGTPDVTITVKDATLPDNSDLVLFENFAITPATDLTVGESISVTCKLYNQEQTTGHFMGTLILGIYEEDGTPVQILEEKTSVSIGARYQSDVLTFSNPSLTTAGDYRLRLYAKAAAADNPKLVGDYSYKNTQNDIPITINAPVPVSYNIAPATTITNGNISINPTSAVAGTTITVTVTPDAGYELDKLTYQSGGQTINITATNNVYSFAMPAHDVTVSATFKKSADQLAVEAAKLKIEAGIYTVAQATANTEETVKTWLVAEINKLISGITIEASNITISSFTPAMAGSPGTKGSFSFTVTLKKGNSTSVTTSAKSGEITPGLMSITTQPKDTTIVTVGSITGSLSVAVNATTGITPTYQWYSCDDDTGTNPQAFAGATTTSFAIPTDLAIGTYYYYVEVSAPGATKITSTLAVVIVHPVPVYGISIGTLSGGTLVAKPSSAEAGTSITVTATPAQGYELISMGYYNVDNPEVTTPIGGTGNERTFTMPAYAITLTAVFNKTADQQAVEAAKDLIEGKSEYTVAQATANTEETVKTWLATELDGLVTDITISNIAISDFTAAIEGRPGENGKFTFSASLQKGNSGTVTATSDKGVITATLLIDAKAPVINTQPSDATTTKDYNDVTLEVEATSPDNGTLSYEWFSCDATAANSQSTNIKDKQFTPSTATVGTFYYYVVVTNTNATVNGIKTATTISQIATVTIEAPVDAETPVISEQPESRTVSVGGNVVLNVRANVSDGGTLTYQWYDDNGAIANATGTSYTAPTTAEGNTDYYVVVTNTNANATGVKTATATSQAATVTVNNLVNAEAPVIDEQPQDQTVSLGGSVTLTVAATSPDNGELSYQWYSNAINSNAGGTAVSNATSDSYKPSTAAEGTFYYYVIVTNTNEDATGVKTATTTSRPATVTVQTDAKAPVINTQPQDATVNTGASVTLTVSATSPDNGTLTYQWYNSAGAISGATGTNYSPSTATAGTNGYYVTVTNTNNAVSGKKTATATSRTATVTVTTPTPEPEPEPTPDTYTVAIAGMTNGSVTASPANAEAGTTISLTISPAQGYRLNTIAAHRTGSSATTVALSGSGNARTFTMPAYDVTVQATFSKTEEQLEKEVIDESKKGIEGGTFRVAQATANAETPLRTWLVNTLNALFGNSRGIQFRSETLIDADVNLTSITPAIAGTEENPTGTNGSFTFTVTLTKGASSVTTEPSTGVIVAMPYAGVEVKNVEFLNLGELAVRILNTGNVETGKLTLTLSGADAELFSLLPATLDNLEVGEEMDIMLTPKAILAARKYALTLTAEAEKMEPVSIDITYSTIPTGIDEIGTQSLQAKAVASGLMVYGLTPGEYFQVYNMQGQLFYRGKATANEQFVSLRDRGVYIITTENQTTKVVY